MIAPTQRPPSYRTRPASEELRQLAVKIAEDAASLLEEGANRARTHVSSKSSATDMVTDMDRGSEDLIVGALRSARPDDGIMAEEGSAREGTSGLRWVIDPLDGTTNFLYGYGSWAVSIAVDSPEGTLAGAVVDVPRRETFSAARGGGAHRSGEAIRCSAITDVSQALVATGFAYASERREQQAQVLVGVLPRVRDIRRGGSAAVDLCSVACGRVDAYYERGLSWWDHAAGALIAGEAGAHVRPLAGDSVKQGALIAAAPGVVDELVGILVDHDA